MERTATVHQTEGSVGPTASLFWPQRWCNWNQ